MPLSPAERKRRSRAANPDKCRSEKEKSRERMSVYRGKIRAQKRAQEFKALLTDVENEELAVQARRHKVALLGDWLKDRDLGFSAEVMIQRNILNLFVCKIEMHKIERGVAEFEVGYIQEMLMKQSANGEAGGAGRGSADAATPPASHPTGLAAETAYYRVPPLPPLPPAVTSSASANAPDALASRPVPLPRPRAQAPIRRDPPVKAKAPSAASHSARHSASPPLPPPPAVSPPAGPAVKIAYSTPLPPPLAASHPAGPGVKTGCSAAAAVAPLASKPAGFSIAVKTKHSPPTHQVGVDRVPSPHEHAINTLLLAAEKME